ncbi:MAG: hypothetical protein REI09_04680 [Candidatus Dactylopiibacterium sp.]|nr:hypothetical protein [Candidatus Dactylopiibacterium sp.]
MPDTSPPDTLQSEPPSRLRGQTRFVLLLYLLHAAGFVAGPFSAFLSYVVVLGSLPPWMRLFGEQGLVPGVVGGMLFLSPVVAMFFNYAWRRRLRGSFLYHHLRWQANTFWIGLFLVLLVGCSALLISMNLDVVLESLHPILIMLIGIFGLGLLIIALCGWMLYRLVRGGWALVDGRAPLDTPPCDTPPSIV